MIPLHIYASPGTSSRFLFCLIKNFCYNYVLTSAYLKKLGHEGPLGIEAKYGQILNKNPMAFHPEVCENIKGRPSAVFSRFCLNLLAPTTVLRLLYFNMDTPTPAISLDHLLEELGFQHYVESYSVTYLDEPMSISSRQIKRKLRNILPLTTTGIRDFGEISADLLTWRDHTLVIKIVRRLHAQDLVHIK